MHTCTAFIHAGIILVHDLTNRKSYHNLDKWGNEIINVMSGRGMFYVSDALFGRTLDPGAEYRAVWVRLHSLWNGLIKLP